jgi:hypothetical protein
VSSATRRRDGERTLADQERIGTPWRDDELDAIIADSFAMLGPELNGEPYVKSHHSAALMAQIDPTHRSVEFKYQNISAVLEELGLPWITGRATTFSRLIQAGRSEQQLATLDGGNG